MSGLRLRLRRSFTWSHRWFGIIAGFHFVLLGLSGSWLVYEDEIEGLLKPGLRLSAIDNASVDWSRAIATARTGLALTKEPVSVRIPAAQGKNVLVGFDISEPDGPRRIATAYVDPGNQEFRGSEVYRETLSGVIFVFHHDLFWGRTGRTIMAMSGLLMLALLLSGVYLWWPRGSLIKALKLRKSRTRTQFYLDFHKITGIYTLVLMIVVTATGVVISRSDWFLGSSPRAGGGPPPSSEEPLGFDFERAQTRLKDLGLDGRPLSIRIDSRKGQISASTPDKESVALDARTYEVVPAKEKSGPDVRKINHDLHVGDFWGELGRFLIFVSGILPLFFYITGLYVWLKKSPTPAS